MSDPRPIDSQTSQPDVAALAERCLAPGKFFVAPPLRLRIEHRPAEITAWEIFAGHLLDAAVTRQKQTFDSWHLFLDPAEGAAASPLLSLRWQTGAQQLFVTRYILTHAHEAYESQPGVIETRPTQKWVQELVGRIDLSGRSSDDLSRELGDLVLLALIGISRLPITSLESPLTEYALGQIGYLSQAPSPESACTGPLDFARLAITSAASPLEASKAVETALRAISSDETGQLVEVLGASIAGADDPQAGLIRLLRDIFNGAALSPYTGFAERLVSVVEQAGQSGLLNPAETLQLLGHMLRQLGRHLTAFDLTLFHNFGANYPDAIFLDSLLKAFLRGLDRSPELAHGDEPAGRQLRRALRQAYLVRRHYEGQPVPDAPTSMGENARVLPAPFSRVPEEQIVDVGRRRKRLFVEDPTDALLSDTSRELLRRSVEDLSRPEELRELGLAIYLDRPLGAPLPPGQVDRTPLVACEAYSRSLAIRRLAALKSAGLVDGAKKEELAKALTSLDVSGVRAGEMPVVERPGVVSLADANKAALDFVLLRNLRTSLNSVVAPYQWRPLARRFASLVIWLLKDQQVLVIPRRDSPQAAPRLEFYRQNQLNLRLGFASGATVPGDCRQASGSELPRRLQVLAARNADGELIELADETIWIELRELESRG